MNIILNNIFLAITISPSSAWENCCPSTSLNLTCENEDICEKNSNMFGLYKTRFPTGTFLTCYGYYIDQLYERSVNNATYYLYRDGYHRCNNGNETIFHSCEWVSESEELF